MRLNSTLIIRQLILLTLFLFPFGHFTRLQITHTVAIYPHDLTIFLINALVFIPYLMHHKKLPTFPFKNWLASFTAVAILSLVTNYPQFGSQSLTGILYLLRWLNIALLYPLLIHLTKEKIITTNLKTTLLHLSITLAFLGLLQYIFIPDTRFLFQLGWDDHLNRLISTLFDPAFTGIILVLGFILNETHESPSTPFAALFLVTTMLTYSRAAFLSLVFAIILISLQSRSVRYFISRLSLALLLLVLLPRTQGDGVKLERAYSISSRIESTSLAIISASHNPLTGVGFNNYRLLVNRNSDLPSHTSAPDNSFAFLFVTTGLLGLSVYSLGLLNILARSHKTSPALFISTIILIIHSFTNNTLFHPFIIIWFSILLAATVPRLKASPSKT